MQRPHLRALAGALAVTALVAACGGSDTADIRPLANSYTSALAQMGSVAGLSDPALADMFDSTYLDSGLTKSQVLAALAAESQALGASSDHSLFPQATLKDVQVTDCSLGICTLSGTLQNADADVTEVPFSTRVAVVNGALRLLGDQQSS